jgi:uncharacterized Zn-finger protein
MSGLPRYDLFKKQSAPKKMDIIKVKTEAVSCANDHPKVYYKLVNQRAECQYCGRIFIYE